MHKRRFNEMTVRLAIRPQGPILIKSGKEAGANPTLLDMNFVRATHPALGGETVYLPGSSLKGVMRSYAEKIARTVGEGVEHDPPFACNPPGMGERKGQEDYFCGRWIENQRGFNAAQKHANSCPICRTFGNTALAGHLRVADAFPTSATVEAANTTEQRDGIAIDRISGAVAVGPFNLEVVTQGEFVGTVTLSNFQLWQVGLLAIVLRDIGLGRVPLGFGKTRGLGTVDVRTTAVEVAYPGRFGATSNGHNFGASLYPVTTFLSEADAGYGYVAEHSLPLPAGAETIEDGSFGRFALRWDGVAAGSLLAGCVPAWAAFIAAWRGE